MSDVWLPIGTALLGAAVALAGSFIGPWLTERRDHRRWIRDKVADKVETLYAVLQQAQREAALMNGLGEDYRKQDPRPDVLMSIDDLHDLSRRLESASANVQLYAARHLRAFSRVVPVWWDNVLAWVERGEVYDPESESWKIATSDVVQAFQTVATDAEGELRKQLGLT